MKIGRFEIRTNEQQPLSEVALDASLRAALNENVVNSRTAMQIPAVEACVNYITATVSSLPVRLYRESDGASEEVRDDYRLRLVNQETGDLLDAKQFKSALIKDYLLDGEGYAFVNRKGTKVESLHYVDRSYVSFSEAVDPIFKSVDFLIQGRKYREFEVMRMLKNTKNGIDGRGIVDTSSLLLDTMLSTLSYESKMVKTGSKKGFLKSSKKLTQDMMNHLRLAWSKLYGSNSSESVVVLNDGLEFQDAGQTAVDAQLNQNKTSNAKEVYKVFGISPAVMDGTASEADIKQTINTAIKPVAQALQDTLNRFLLLETEKGVYYFEVDLDSLDTTSILTRYQAYEIAVRNGWMKLDEVRYEEGLCCLGLDFIRLGLDTVIYDPVDKTIYTPNTKEWAVMTKGGMSDEGGNQGEESDVG